MNANRTFSVPAWLIAVVIAGITIVGGVFGAFRINDRQTEVEGKLIAQTAHIDELTVQVDQLKELILEDLSAEVDTLQTRTANLNKNVALANRKIRDLNQIREQLLQAVREISEMP